MDLKLIAVVLIVAGALLLMLSGADYLASYLFNEGSTSEIVDSRSSHTYLISPMILDLPSNPDAKYIHVSLTIKSKGKIAVKVVGLENETIYNFTSEGYLNKNFTLPGLNEYKLIIYDIPDVNPEIIDLSMNITYKIKEEPSLPPSLLNAYKIMVYPGMGLLIAGIIIGILLKPKYQLI